ncbi:hypothetical protein GQX74_005282 [Glossina fuscipes]|nr:hypothetical protein GQX74_005282 [Glossina fuscipes]
MSIRHDWYQSDAKVVVTVLLKNAKEKNYKVTIESKHLNMTADGYELDLRLYAPINVERSFYKDYPSKVEITLAKQAGIRWESLETKTASVAPIAPPPIHKKNWDSLAKEVEKKEEEEAQSEEALQRLFKKIYSSSSPEVQKAMNKSFSESGGTVLSTNWNEVSKQQVEVKPPEASDKDPSKLCTTPPAHDSNRERFLSKMHMKSSRVLELNPNHLDAFSNRRRRHKTWNQLNSHRYLHTTQMKNSLYFILR